MEQWLREFEASCKNLGIVKGDIIYISSDITMLLYRLSKKYGIKTKADKSVFLNRFVDLMKELVGEEGTILVPMFTWSFCRGIDFDIQKTPRKHWN